MAEKARTPQSGAEREAKYAFKMKEKDYETWCAKKREKRRKCIDSMSEQKREEMNRRDRERKYFQVTTRSRRRHARAPLRAWSTDSSVIICTFLTNIMRERKPHLCALNG